MHGKTVAFAFSLVPSIVAMSAVVASAQEPIPLPTVEVAGSQNQKATAKKGKSKSKSSEKVKTATPAQSPPSTVAPDDSQAGVKAAEGTAKEGYKVDNVNFGQLGERKIQDIPTSVNVISSDFIRNEQANNLLELTKYLPSAQMSDYGSGGAGPSGGQGRFQTRGFVSSPYQNTRIDGMTAWIASLPPENYQRLEVLNGLTGALYGTANPSGTFNLVQKRPLSEMGGEISGLYRGDAIGQGFIDANSGNIGGVAIRYTGLYQDGEGWTPNSEFRRELESLALDWHISPQTVIETNFTRSIVSEAGFAGNFFYSQNALGQATITLPKPIDPTNPAFGQSYYPSNIENDTVTMQLRHKINHDWSFNVGALYQEADIYSPRFAHTLTNSNGDYTTRLAHVPVIGYTVGSNTISLDGHFDAFGISHDVTIGSNGYWVQSNFLKTAPNVLVGSSNIYDPTLYPRVDFPFDDATYPGKYDWAQNLIFSDTVTLNRYWQLMFTGNQGWMASDTEQTPFSSPGSYRASGFSPSTSVIFKPVENLTTYFTYASSLQQGDTAPANAVNAFEGLAPYRSEQYEAGVKLRMFDLDLTAAVFQIERPFANVAADGVFRNIGNQVNTGVEFFTSGKLTSNIAVFGGVTLIDPELQDTGIATTNGKDMVGIPRVKASMLVEYAVPQIPGLTLGTNVSYTGRSAADNANTAFIDDYTLVDLSARYVTMIQGHETTYRLNINNVTNTEYWASVLPSNLVGSAAGTYTLTAGKPLDVFASASIKF